jgi:hypothetical protein
MLKRTAVLTVAIALAVAGCTKEPEVEKVAVGSDVQLTQKDGGVVAGKVTAKDEKTVQVETGKTTKTTKTVPKEQVAEVQVVPKDAPAPPPPPPIAKYRAITIPADTNLPLEVETALNTKTTTIETPVEARLTEAVTIDGTQVLPVGSKVRGNVSAVTAAGKVKGIASITIRFDRLVAYGESHPMQADFTLTAPSTKKKDVAKIGIGAAAGAVIGAIAGGGKGAAIGAAVGGGAGTGWVLMTAGEEINIPAGTAIAITLDRAVEVKVPIK